MPYKEIGSPPNADTWDFDKEKEFEGVYASKRENIGENESTMYYFEALNGGQVAVWGSAVIDTKMSQVALGSRVKITYLGKQKSEKTGRSYKDFKIEVWTEEDEANAQAQMVADEEREVMRPF